MGPSWVGGFLSLYLPPFSEILQYFLGVWGDWFNFLTTLALFQISTYTSVSFRNA